MFCPRCGTDNESQRKYCRQCGLALSPVRLALEGRVHQAVTSLMKGRKHLLISSIGFFLFSLITILSLLTDGQMGFANVPSAVIFALAVLALSISGVVRVWSGTGLLSSGRQPSPLHSGEGESGRVLSPDSFGTARMPDTPVAISATEDTTREMNQSE